ncbi:MAG: DUF4177 domain-containing protein [Paracoccaceae bacterium]
MTSYEYKVVPAPTKGQKAKGVKASEDRFALGIQTLMNDYASDGWEYLRADTLPSTERAGLTGSTTEWRNLLVFRRVVSSSVNNAVHAEPNPVSTPVPAANPVPKPAPRAIREQPESTPAEEASENERLRSTLYPRQEPKLSDNSEA